MVLQAARPAALRVIELDLEVPLDRFTLRVAARLGAVTAVLGPSGSGKTTLLESVAGLRRGARGRVVIDGAVVLDTARGLSLPPERRLVGYVPQDAGLFPHLSVRDNIGFGARGPADGAIDVLELRPLLDRHPARLSGGERQRVALARALASRPRVLLLDEPLASLDARLRERLLPWLLRVRREFGVPLLHVTHDVGEALALGGEALLLQEGALLSSGPVESLLRLPAARAGSERGLENLFPGLVEGHDPDGGTTRVRLESGPVSVTVPLTAAAAAGSEVTVAIRAEDVLVAAGPLPAVSARNVLAASLTALEPAGADVILRCAVDGCARPWIVLLTPAAVRALGLEAGGRVALAVKSHSIRLL